MICVQCLLNEVKNINTPDLIRKKTCNYAGCNLSYQENVQLKINRGIKRNALHKDFEDYHDSVIDFISYREQVSYIKPNYYLYSILHRDGTRLLELIISSHVSSTIL